MEKESSSRVQHSTVQYSTVQLKSITCTSYIQMQTIQYNRASESGRRARGERERRERESGVEGGCAHYSRVPVHLCSSLLVVLSVVTPSISHGEDADVCQGCEMGCEMGCDGWWILQSSTVEEYSYSQ